MNKKIEKNNRRTIYGVTKISITMSYFDYNKEVEKARNEGNIERMIELITDRKVALMEIECFPYHHNNRPLFKACKKGDLELVEMLMKNRNVNPDDNNHRALMVALDNDYIKIIKQLRYTLESAFCVACEYGHAGVVKKVLNKYEIDPGAYNNRALRIATWNLHSATISLLLNTGKVNPNEEITIVIHEYHRSAIDIIRNKKCKYNHTPTTNENKIEEMLNEYIYVRDNATQT